MFTKPRITFLSALFATSLIIAATAMLRNDWWEYCTTRAWGWPFPWRVDWCECGGGQTEYPLYSMVLNPLLAVGFAWCLSRLFRPRPRPTAPALGIGKLPRR